MSWVITGSEKNPVDLFRSNVSLLLHGDGANGSKTIIDSSPSPKTVTAVGNAQISTAQSKFGGSSFFFSLGGFELPVGNAFNFATENLTIETFVFPLSISTNAVIWSQRSATSNGISFRISNAGKLDMFLDNIGTTFTTGSSTLSLNTWQHVAITREGTFFKLWLNGALEATSASTSASVTSNESPKIARSTVTTFESYNGYMDEFRVTKGIARYTANFTPPTAPFPDI